MVGSTRDELIKQYFNIGFSYKEILVFLSTRHNISLSLRQLKRVLKNTNLSRRKSRSTINSVMQFISSELTTSTSCFGYRAMHQKLVMNGYVVDHDTVRLVLKSLDPEGVERRARHRLTRRVYVSAGPNHTWHVDGYDKIKPFGFAIHGAIDGYSRKILWLLVGPSNNDPKITATYFVNCLVEQQLVPRLIRTDRGSENITIGGIQRFLRRGCEDENAAYNSFKFGPSTRNQRIEAWWSILRRTRFSWWIDFFKDLCENGSFDASINCHLEVIRFCFIGLIQTELDEVKEMWNNHRIRFIRNSECPSGRPNVLYHAPQLTGGIECKFPLSQSDITVARTFCQDSPLFGCPKETVQLCHIIMSEKDLQIPSTPEEAKLLFETLITEIQAI